MTFIFIKTMSHNLLMQIDYTTSDAKGRQFNEGKVTQR